MVAWYLLAIPNDVFSGGTSSKKLFFTLLDEEIDWPQVIDLTKSNIRLESHGSISEYEIFNRCWWTSVFHFLPHSCPSVAVVAPKILPDLNNYEKKRQKDIKLEGKPWEELFSQASRSLMIYSRFNADNTHREAGHEALGKRETRSEDTEAWIVTHD